MVGRSVEIQFLLRAATLASLIRCTRHSLQSRVRLRLVGRSVQIGSPRYTASSILALFTRQAVSAGRVLE